MYTKFLGRVEIHALKLPGMVFHDLLQRPFHEWDSKSLFNPLQLGYRVERTDEGGIKVYLPEPGGYELVLKSSRQLVLLQESIGELMHLDPETIIYKDGVWDLPTRQDGWQDQALMSLKIKQNYIIGHFTWQSRFASEEKKRFDLASRVERSSRRLAKILNMQPRVNEPLLQHELRLLNKTLGALPPRDLSEIGVVLPTTRPVDIIPLLQLMTRYKEEAVLAAEKDDMWLAVVAQVGQGAEFRVKGHLSRLRQQFPSRALQHIKGFTGRIPHEITKLESGEDVDLPIQSYNSWDDVFRESKSVPRRSLATDALQLRDAKLFLEIYRDKIWQLMPVFLRLRDILGDRDYTHIIIE